MPLSHKSIALPPPFKGTITPEIKVASALESPRAVSYNLIIRTPHSRRAPSRPLGLSVLLCLCASTSFLTLPSRAQDPQQDAQQVAEAARQEKARKAAQQKKETHVYTNEELKQSQILTQQDRSRVEARKNNPPAAPASPVQPAVNAEKNSAPESLGEVARRYRRQKLENSEAAEAAKRQPASRFPMDLSQPAFASPVKPVAPLASPNSHPRQNAKPLLRIAPARRDPFSRQSFSPPLPSERAPRSPNSSAPPKPAISLADVAPRAPAVRTASPPAAPILLLPSKPLLARPSLAPRDTPVAPIVNNISRAKEIRIQPGDSLWKLARRHLGSGSRWNVLLASNPGISDPNRLQPGAMLVVPTTELRSRVQPSSITIHSGDSLWKIAASQLGSAAAWPCIAQANLQLRDANRLRPGQILSIPASCAPSLLR
jgi:nucleoid-associated protein YgaU